MVSNPADCRCNGREPSAGGESIVFISRGSKADSFMQFTQLIDYYLGEGKEHLPEIHRLAKIPGDESDKKLLHYAMEGIRLNGTFGSYRVAIAATSVDDGERGQIHVKPGDRVFCSFVSANREAEFFPDPDKVRIDRPMENYIHYGLGPHACLGGEASRVGLTAMLRTVAKLENLRRAPGPPGQLKKIPRPGGFYVYMRADHGSYWPFPTSEYPLCRPPSRFDADRPCSHEGALRRRAPTLQEDELSWRMGQQNERGGRLVAKEETRGGRGPRGCARSLDVSKYPPPVVHIRWCFLVSVSSLSLFLFCIYHLLIVFFCLTPLVPCPTLEP